MHRSHSGRDCDLIAELLLFRYTDPANMMRDSKVHEHFMGLALREAGIALQRKEIPVGAVIVKDGAVIGKGSNQREMLQDPTAHAEMIAITAAASHLGNRRLEGCAIYVTLEPCPMCAGAIVLAQVPLLVFGAYDPKAGACTSLYTITNDTRLNHRVHTIGGVLEQESGSLLREFFLKRRKDTTRKDYRDEQFLDREN